MCVAILKPAGAECPSMSVLKDCWDANKDGAGVAVSEKDSVFICKGFMKFADFESWFHKAKLGKRVGQAIVFHFRIGTHGCKDGGNTHPFPVSDKPKVLRQLTGRFSMAVAHNGIFSNKVTLPDVSDTGQFLADCAAAGGDPLKFWDDNKNVTGWSRLVVLKPGNAYALRGDWHCVEGSGCLFSNLGWKRYVPVTPVKSTVGFHGRYGECDESDYGDWWNRVPSGSYGVRKSETGGLTTVVKGKTYVAKYLTGEKNVAAACSLCVAGDMATPVTCGDFGHACAGNHNMYWAEAEEPAKPAKGIMTPGEVAAAGGVSVFTPQVKQPAPVALIKVTRINPANGQEYVSYIAAGGKLVEGPEATLAAAQAALCGFGAKA